MGTFFNKYSTAPAFGATSNTITPTVALSVGQTCVLVINKSFAETVSTVTDNGGNTWSYAGDFGNGSSFRSSVWTCAVNSAATTITATYSAASTTSAPQFLLYRATGINHATRQFVGNYQASVTTAADNVTSTTLTPSGQPGWLIGFSYPRFTTAIASGTGFTDEGTDTISAQNRWEDKAISALSAVAATFTASGTGPHTTVAIYFQDNPPTAPRNRVMFIG